MEGVCNGMEDMSRLEAECRQGRDFGFDGKTLIHPAQIAVANRCFAPDAEAVASARRIIEAFAIPDNRSRGVIRVDGQMVERLHLEEARRLVALDEAIWGRPATDA